MTFRDNYVCTFASLNVIRKGASGPARVHAMDYLILAAKKRVLFPAIALLGFIFWCLMCRAYHIDYWYGTIYHVETVDFNLLHHTLPTTLSQLIIADRDDLIEKVLDSNYGLFGLVITDRTGQSILYKTSHDYRQHQSWGQSITPESLAKLDEPFDWLTDPPPLEPRFVHKDPLAASATKTKAPVSGKQLGRVYYVRNVPPTLIEDLSSFTSGHFWEMNGSKRGYLLITLIALSFSTVAMLLIMLRRRKLQLKQQELEHVHRELEIRKKALEHLSAELSTQKARKSSLEREADQSYQRALNLKHSLVRLRDAVTPAFAQVKAAAGGESNIKVRPPVHPPSAILEEIESMIPDLTMSAGSLKAQAGMLNDYCAILEQRQFEMERLTQESARRAGSSSGEVLDMSPEGAQF
jgi:hypothetical protein